MPRFYVSITRTETVCVEAEDEEDAADIAFDHADPSQSETDSHYVEKAPDQAKLTDYCQELRELTNVASVPAQLKD